MRSPETEVRIGGRKGVGRIRMGIREVLQLGEPRLREKCARVEKPGAEEIRALIEDLRDTLAHWRVTTGYGRGIAAPQVGVLKRVIFLKLPGEVGRRLGFGDGRALINPEIVARSEEKMVVWDACLSFLCIFMKVERHKEVTVRYQDTLGEWHELKAGVEGDLSELLQHEIDHLDGVLCIDRVKDVRTIVTKEEFEKRYRMESPYA
jgi:peptide deformylase